jgi:hypothetical protein
MKTLLQLNEKMPNPVTEMSGYEPQHDYWRKVINLTNVCLEVSVTQNYHTKVMKSGVDKVIELEIFPTDTPHSAVEWAEFVMALNHVLWVLHEAQGHDKYVDEMLRILDFEYYRWHNRALDTLKGANLSTYLKITD